MQPTTIQSPKSRLVALLLCIFRKAGHPPLLCRQDRHRHLMILTGGGCGIWTLD